MIFGHFIDFGHFPIEIPIEAEKFYGQQKEGSYIKNKNCFENRRPNVRNVRNVKNCGIERFKEALDSFLSKVPDEPKTDGLTPGATDLISGRATNSLEYQCARRREAWDSSDFDFGQGH